MPDIKDWSTTAGDNIQSLTGIDWDENMLPSQVNNSARDTLAQIAQFVKDVYAGITQYYDDTGAANAYVITPAPAVTAYAAGQSFTFLAGNANTGASTLQVNALLAKTILRYDGSALAAGDIAGAPDNSLVTVIYDGTNFRAVSPLGAAVKDASNNFTVAQYIGDTSNANMSLGLTINEGANHEEILSLKSSDVAHGITARTETDTFCKVRRIGATTGGVSIDGYSTDRIGVRLTGSSAVIDTTKGNASRAPLILDARVHSGSTDAAVTTANGNLLAVQKGTTSVFIVDVEGDLHVDGSGSLTTYDMFDDAALVRAIDLELGDPSTIIDSKWDEYIDYNRETLIEVGILGKTNSPEDIPMINVTRLQRLHNGAIWQLYTQIREMGERLEAASSGREIARLKVRLAALEASGGAAHEVDLSAQTLGGPEA